MNLRDLISKIISDEEYKQSLLDYAVDNSSTRKKPSQIFEERLFKLLQPEYTELKAEEFKQKNSFKYLKGIFSNKAISDEIIDYAGDLTDLTDDKTIIYQPFGSQKFPDILIINGTKVIPFEMKSGKGDRPTWNQGLPVDPGVYIFARIDEEKNNFDATVFMGRDILPNEVKQKLVTLVNNYRKELAKNGAEITADFDVYLREMYNQKTSIINRNNRHDLEQEVFSYLSKHDI